MRIERDSLGEVEVPTAAYYGVQTVRAIRNFPITGWPPHPLFVEATVLVKKAAAITNKALGSWMPSAATRLCGPPTRCWAGRCAISGGWIRSRRARARRTT